MPVKSTSDFTDSFKVAIFLFKWRKMLLIIGIAAALLSALFSSPLFITPLYKSTLIMYPASGNSISQSLLKENTDSRQNILEYGADEQTQQMLQILNSNRIRDKVIVKFNLAEHYGINPESKYFHTRLNNRYRSNITFKLTEYLAVKIIVLDKEPEIAAEIAVSIASLLDTVKIEMQKERAIQGFKLVEAEYHSQLEQVRIMEDSLTRFRKLGVNDYESQSEMLNRQLAIELARGNKQGVSALEEKLDVLSIYGGPYVSIRDALLHEKKQLSYLKARYEEAKIDAYEAIPQKFIIESASKAERKSYPVIWIVVVLSTLGCLLTGMLVIFLVERAPDFMQRLKQT